MILNGVKKSAILLMSMELKELVKVLKHLNFIEIQKLIRIIITMNVVDEKNLQLVKHEFNECSLKIDNCTIDHINNHFFEALSQFLGKEKVKNLFNEEHELLLIDNYVKEFNFLSPRELFLLIKEEHLQIIAIIFCYIDKTLSSKTLYFFEDFLKTEIMLKMSNFYSLSRQGKILFSRILSNLLKSRNQKDKNLKGIRIVSGILQLMKNTNKIRMLKKMKLFNTKLVQDILHTSFKFSNILNLEDIYIKTIIKSITLKQLIVILKISNLEIQKKFLKNMDEIDINEFKKEFSKKLSISKSEEEKEKYSMVVLIQNLFRNGTISIDILG